MQSGLKRQDTQAARSASRPLNTIDTMHDSIKQAGFRGIRHQDFQLPIGDWSKKPHYKKAGVWNKKAWVEGGAEGVRASLTADHIHGTRENAFTVCHMALDQL